MRHAASRLAWILVVAGAVAATPFAVAFAQEPASRLSDCFGDGGAEAPPRTGDSSPRAGRVRVVDHALVDDGGPFLGLGASYFSALWRFRNDRERLESDLAFLSAQGFNYYRMLSMVGWNAYWEGREIAPVAFTSREGVRVDAWPDYWQQLRELVDLAYARFGLRTQITIFADAQLMLDKQARFEHMRKLLAEVVAGREHKILLLEVANEAWQNGFPGDQGVADLKEFAKFLAERTEVPVAITSNHEGSFADLYRGSAADLATWHFSRDLAPDDGWKPVYDCWEFGDLPDCPPAVSNEPIGPGSSVAAESEVNRLAMAAAFAYLARLPAYVFHCEAGVKGRTRLEDAAGIDGYERLMELLPGDLANWKRHDGKEESSLFTVFAAGKPNTYSSEVAESPDGCVRLVGSRRDDCFIAAAIGIRPGGLLLEARTEMQLDVHDPLTGLKTLSANKQKGEQLTVPPGDGAVIILGRVVPEPGS